MSELIVVLWLTVLTVAQIFGAALLLGIRRRWDRLESRETALDNAERMQRLLDMLGRGRDLRDKDIRRETEVLLARLEDDPASRDRHWTSIQVLRNKLANP